MEFNLLIVYDSIPFDMEESGEDILDILLPGLYFFFSYPRRRVLSPHQKKSFLFSVFFCRRSLMFVVVLDIILYIIYLIYMTADEKSVGKSTVINALLGDQFSEVSMRRTTAGINYFRVSQKQKGLATATATSNANANATAGKETTTTSSNNNSSGKNVSTAEATHAEISRDNEMLRSGISNSSGGGGDNEDENNDENDDDDETSSNKNGALLVEKFFDIEVDESICDMRNDTKLVLIDIPGINEADSSKKYKDYVESKWDTFDCVVVVMDAIQGVNTQEQVELLKFVQRNNHHLKRIPTIVLGNKVDDPSDEDTLTLVGETRTKTIEIFGDGCTEKSLQSLLTAANNGNYYAKNKDKDGK